MIRQSFVLIAFFWLVTDSSLNAQPLIERSAFWASNQPEIRVDTIGNSLKFYVDWDEVNFKSEPDDIIAGQIEPARWEYFWMFGDGKYRRGDTVMHAYTSTAEREVSLLVRGIYTNDKEPPVTRRPVKPAGFVSPGDQPSNFDGVPANKSVNTEFNWNSSVPGDTVIVALNFRNIDRQQSASGTLYFMYPEEEVSVVGVSGQTNGLTSVNPGNALGYSGALAWDFSSLDPGQLGERTIFLTLKVSGDLNDFFQGNPDQIEVENEDGGGTTEVLNDASVPLFMASAIEFDPQEDDDPISFGDLFGFPVGQDGGTTTTGNNNFFSPDDLTTNTLGIRLSRDPNNIEVDPVYILPGTQTQPWKYTVNFQNFGSASAKKVEVESEIDDQLNLLSYDDMKTAYDPSGSDFANTVKPVGADKLGWTIVRTDGAGFLPGTAEIAALVQDDDMPDSLAHDASSGFVKYELTPKNINFQVGDTVKAVATIYMDGVPLRTSPAYTIVRQPQRLQLPWYFGAKAGVNATGFGSTGAAGFHFGVTARKGFGSLSESFAKQRKISTQALPEFWYQAELMASRVNLSTTGGPLNSWYLDLVPLQIRFVPKSLPGGILAPYTNNRMFGISAGYMASLLLSANLNSESQSLSALNFGDRIDHSLFAGFEIFNILGTPGLSIGYRFHRRFGHLVALRTDYNLSHLFLHYNF